VARTELDWRNSDFGTPDYLPWMPLAVSRFVTYLTDAMGAVEPPSGTFVRFLDVGCGPGTKVFLAQALFGVAGYGIDRVQEYVDAAKRNGVNAECTNAFHFQDYARYDIVYLNKPCHGDLEAKLELKIKEEMAPGAVLILANAAEWPFAWEQVAVEWDLMAGVWKKPCS
jgi:SAM-dependent methyltransferase